MATARRQRGTFYELACRQVHHDRGRNREVEVTSQSCSRCWKWHRAGQWSQVAMVFLTILLVLAPTRAFAADSSAAVELRISSSVPRPKRSRSFTDCKM